MNAKVEMIRVKAMDDFGTKVSYVSKQRCPVDTGALRDSINNKLNKLEPTLVQEKVFAGDPEVRRGIGKYAGGFEGRAEKIQGTNEYAIAVELGLGGESAKRQKGKGYMETGFKWAIAKGTKELGKSIRKIMRLI